MKGFAASSQCRSPVSCTSDSNRVAGSAASSLRRSSTSPSSVSCFESSIFASTVSPATLPGCRQKAKPICWLDGAGSWSANACAMKGSGYQEVIDWLVEGARSARTPMALMSQTCERLVAAGLPIWRAAAFVRTLHPDVLGRSFVWRPDEEVVVNAADFDVRESPEFVRSPLAILYRSGHEVRYRL